LISPWVTEEKSTPKTSPAGANGVLESTTGTVHMLLEKKIEKPDKNCFLRMRRWKNDPDTGEKWVLTFELFTAAVSVKKNFISIVLLLFTMKKH
jgi:hypothetical protein